MSGMNLCLGRAARLFLLSALAACCGSGAALATCNPADFPGTTSITPGQAVPCYVKVQPIDVGTTAGVYAPFNTVSATAGIPGGSTSLNLPPAGNPLQTLNNTCFEGCSPVRGPDDLLGLTIPSNSRSRNPIGFIVDPGSGLSPGQSNYDATKGVDVTRALLNHLGVELVWLPMATYTTSTLTQLQVDLAPTGGAIATCTGFILNTTLTISSCNTGSQPLAIYNFLSSPNATITPNTYITAFVTGAGGAGTYTLSQSQTVGGSGKKQVTITARASTLTSAGFKTLSQQDTSVNSPLAISKGGIPVAPLGGANSFTSPDPTVVNLFFVNNLVPPAAMGGTLYGLGWLCNNGVAISATTFQPARPDTIAHELLHNLCLDHTTYGAGPWTAPTNPDGSYAAPFGVVPLTPATPLPGECDSNYLACGANLMTTGSLRTEPTLQCILAGFPGTTPPTACTDAFGNLNKPGLFIANTQLQADQLTFSTRTQNGVTVLPVPQQAQVLGNSGLLFDNAQTQSFPSTPLFSGLLSPIPQETTKAQLGTDGSSTDRAIFDLSGPADGKPGATLLGWVLTLPQDQTFAKHDGFRIVSQSRKDLVQEVKYYPGAENNPLKRNIDYQASGDKNGDNPTITGADPGPCALAAAECLVVKFQPPGLEANESIRFSKRILIGDATISNEDLCKAKITYIFSDGFVTTSNFGPCAPVSQPMIANSWHPDPYVAPHVVKSNLLLADGGGALACTPVANPTPPPDFICPDVDQTSLSDSDVTQEAGQSPQSCDGGATLNNPVTGFILGGSIIIQGGQTCHYQDCEFLGSLTINNATAYLKNCKVDGQLTMNSGRLFLSSPDSGGRGDILGNIVIGDKNNSFPNSFSIAPGTVVNNLTIQNLSSGGLGYVCGSTFSGNVSVNNNASTIQIGEPSTLTNCPGNRISGGLSCTNNTATPIGGQNTYVGKGGSGQCATF